MRTRAVGGPKSARLPAQSGSNPPDPEIPRGGGQSPGRYLNAFWNPPFGNIITTIRRDSTGKLIRGQVKAEHACFIPAEKVTEKLLSGLRSSRHVTRIHPEGRYVRVNWTDSRICRKAAAKDGWFKSAHHVDALEADVDPVRRWITESGILIQKPRRVYFDIETDSRVSFSQKREARILIWSLVSADASYQRTGVLVQDSDAAERDLLRELWTCLQDFDQIVAWNGDRFDFEMLDLRSKYLGIAVERRRWLWLDHMLVFKKFNAHAAKSGAEKQSMSLASVSKAVLNEDKLVHLGKAGVSSWGLWEAGGEDRETLRLYCLDDSLKMQKIEERTGYIELLQALCEATFVFPDTRGMNPTAQVEGFMMRMGLERGIKFPTRHFQDEDDEEEREQYAGAYRVPPRDKGILRNVHVADFERMYPSILISFNMSPETWAENKRIVETEMSRPLYLSHLPLQRWPIPEGHCAAAGTDLVFRNEPEGILPAAVSEILRLREHWEGIKKSSTPGSVEWQEANRRVQAYKVAANSFYGVAGSRYSRFFKEEVAESCTLTGKWLIQATESEAVAQGIRTTYIDTDGLFVMGCTEERFHRFVQWCNTELYPRMLSERKAPKNRIRIGYEKAFDRLVMLSRCNYFGSILHFKGKRADENTEPEIKGIAYKRGDSLRLTRDFQQEVIFRILGFKCEPSEQVEDFVEIVERWRDRVLKGELEREDVQQCKRLSKPIREYVSKPKADGSAGSLPSHVEIAKMLRQRGRDVAPGTQIEFVVVDGSETPIRCAPGEDWDILDKSPATMQPTIAGVEPERPWLDRYYLWEAQVYPPTMACLKAAFPAGPWKSFERVRPPKLKGRAAREPELPGLGLAKPAKMRPSAPEKGSGKVSDRSDTFRTRRSVETGGQVSLFE